PVPRRAAGGAGTGRRPRALLRVADARHRAAVPVEPAQDSGGVGARADQEHRGGTDADREGRQFRALRLARPLRRRRYAAADHRHAQPPDRGRRRHRRLSRHDREGRLVRRRLEPRGTETNYHADAGRRCVHHPRIRPGAGIVGLRRALAAPSRRKPMTTHLTRRQYLGATGIGLLSAGLGARPSFALETIRQGYQTNIWGMPTYYLMRSGLLEKRGIKFEEFAVPSGNLTMQQMVARQVDMGTYAAQSFIL